MIQNVEFPSDIKKVENLVGGLWKAGSGEAFEVESPYFGKVVGQGNFSTTKDIDEMTKIAGAALKKWKATPLKERTQVMFRLRELLLKNVEKIAQVISLENGKTLGESKAGVLKGIEVLEFALALQNLDRGGKMEVSRGVNCEYRRESLGIVSNITPFNFPAMVPMWTLPIAITLGNFYIWIPSEKTPLTSLMMGKYFLEAGLPEGVLQIAQGGAPTVEAIIENPDILAIGFVGSTPVAKKIYEKGSAQSKRVLALGGAKNHIVLLPDSKPEISGPGISDSFTGCAGQRCMAASVLLAVGNVEKQIEKIKQRAQSLGLGKDMGAIITREQVNFLSEAIDRAEKAGAKIIM